MHIFFHHSLINSYRVTLVFQYLGCVDLDLGSSPGWWAATVATYCPSKILELHKSKSRQPRYSTTSHPVVQKLIPTSLPFQVHPNAVPAAGPEAVFHRPVPRVAPPGAGQGPRHPGRRHPPRPPRHRRALLRRGLCRRGARHHREQARHPFSKA